MSDQIPPQLPVSTPMPPPPPQRPTRRPAVAPAAPEAPVAVEAPVPPEAAVPAETPMAPVAPEAIGAPVAAAAAVAPEPVAAPAAVAVEPGLSPTSPASTRSRRSLVFALIIALVIGGVVAAFVVSGGDETSADVVDAEGVAVPLVDQTTAPTTSIQPTVTAPAVTAAPTTAAPSTTTAPTTTEAPATTAPAPGYPVLPDGSPEPIVAIFDGPTVRVTGWVPSAEKATQLEGLALANSTDPNAVIDSQLQIDPLVPLNIGTRVIEMNSPRFAAGSSDVTLEHAVQLDRVASVLGLLPNVTVTVVGHADQLGDATANYALSEARAVSVVRYLVGAGINPARLSSRAMGEQDLLAGDSSASSLELNRRTEFIFYGLLAD